MKRRGKKLHFLSIHVYEWIKKTKKNFWTCHTHTHTQTRDWPANLLVVFSFFLLLVKWIFEINKKSRSVCVCMCLLIEKIRALHTVFFVESNHHSGKNSTILIATDCYLLTHAQKKQNFCCCLSKTICKVLNEWIIIK